MAKAKESKEVTTVKTGGALAVPDYIKRGDTRGTEGISREDITIPRIELLSSVSPQVTDGDFKAGEFYHNVMEISLGDEIEIVPIMATIRYMLWKPRHDGGGILARADDGVHWKPPHGTFEVQPYKDVKKKVTWELAPTVKESGLDQWGSTDPDDPDSQPAANKMYTILAWLPQYPQYSPCVITLQRGSAKVGEKFFARLKFSEVAPFGQVFTMKSKLVANKDNEKYPTYVFVASGFPEEDLYRHCESLYDRYSSSGYEIAKEEELIDDPDEVDDEPADGKKRPKL